MKKQTSPTPVPTVQQPPSLADHMEEHPIVQWVSKNGLSLIYLIIGTIFLFMLIYRFYGGSSKSQQDFYVAESSMTELQEDPQEPQVALAKLQTILKAYPELQPKYDGLIAQALLNGGHVQEAKPFAELAINRTESENAPFFTDFAQTSLLIAEKQYGEALQRAQALNQKMLEQEGFRKDNNLLFAYNLMRIGMLQEQTGAGDDAKRTWKEWMAYAEKANENASAANMSTNGFLLLTRVISEGKLSILNYISHQENLK